MYERLPVNVSVKSRSTSTFTCAFHTFASISFTRVSTWKFNLNTDTSLFFATCKSPMTHLICHLKFCISIVFSFFWEGYAIPRRNEKRRLCKVWRWSGGGEIRCIMGDVQVANVKFALLLEKKKKESPYILNK